jgi:cell division protein FtsZ
MHNEIRVTIVATGIGQGVPAKQSGPKEKESAIPPFKLVQRPGEGEAHFRHDRASIRPKAVGDGLSERERADELDYLDIPAFLRRQAD